MTEVTANFELGTLGATITTGDAGDATAWDAVSTGGVIDATYDDTHSIGPQSGKIATTGAGAADNVLTWSTALGGPLTDYYWRTYVYLENLPGATGNCRFASARQSTDYCWSLKCSSAGSLSIQDTTFATIATFSTVMQTAAWTRFEGHIVHGTGAIEIKLFLDPDSVTPTETVSLTGQTIRSDTTAANYGVGSLFTTVWYDAIVNGAAAYPGPITVMPANSVAPVASGTSIVGQTLSSTEGTWTGSPAPTLTYQWQRDDFGGGVYSNIGSATASTYMLVFADSECRVRCVVTGTNVAGSASANSNALGPVTSPPINTVAPVASGTPIVGSLLSVTSGTWTGSGS